jgi:subtilisin family serine protease
VFDDGADIYGYGHGTYMSLIVTDATGVAPDAEILSVRVFGPFGGADPADVVLAINYVKQRRQQVDPSIRVINLSLGGGSYSCSCDDDVPDMAQAVSSAFYAGIVSFAATGNDSQCGGIVTPACVSSAVRVAADYDDDYGTVIYYWPNGSVQCGDFSDEYWVTCFSDVTENCEYFLAAPGYDITVGGFFG